MEKRRLFILMAGIVHLKLAAVESHARTLIQLTNRLSDEIGIRKNLQNLFDSIAVKDSDRGGIYRDIVKQEVTQEQKAFNTMKEKLRVVQNAREKNSRKEINTRKYFTAIKRRGTADDERKLDFYIDLYLELNGAERFDILKSIDPYIGAELRNIPINPSDDPVTLKRMREHVSYHSAMTSLKESIRYVYVRDVLSHAERNPVKLNETTAKTKLALNKHFWTNFLKDPLTNGTGPITRELLHEKGASADEFSERMVWVYDFIYQWSDFFFRVPRNESVNPAKHGWPFTKTHLDFVNIFRKSLNQDALEMIWIDETKDLILPQIVIVDPLVAGTKDSWERLGFF